MSQVGFARTLILIPIQNFLLFVLVLCVEELKKKEGGEGEGGKVGGRKERSPTWTHVDREMTCPVLCRRFERERSQLSIIAVDYTRCSEGGNSATNRMMEDGSNSREFFYFPLLQLPFEPSSAEQLNISLHTTCRGLALLLGIPSLILLLIIIFLPSFSRYS